MAFGQRGVEKPVIEEAVPVKLPKTPWSEEQKKALKTSLAIAAWGILGFGLYIAWPASVPLKPQEIAANQLKARAETCKSSATTAFVMIQEPVTRMLKAPSTASFPWYSDKQVAVTMTQLCIFHIDAYVDAQNSFGAMMRTHFTAEIRMNDDNSWSLIRIATD